MTDYKKLCAELVDQLKQSAEVHWHYGYNKAAQQCDAVVERALTALAEQESRIPKNCWLDEGLDLCPSPCVFDDPSDHVCNCLFATKLETDSKPKTDCKYYRQ